MMRRAMILSMRGLLLAVMAAGVAAQNPVTSGTGGYVGSNACKTCHADVWLNFYKNPHFKSVASGDLPPSRTGCESCHGPGEAHVAAHGGKARSEEHTSELQSLRHLVCRLLLEKKKNKTNHKRRRHPQQLCRGQDRPRHR